MMDEVSPPNVVIDDQFDASNSDVGAGSIIGNREGSSSPDLEKSSEIQVDSVPPNVTATSRSLPAKIQNHFR